MDLSALPTAGELSLLGAHARRWRPGLPCAPHSEVFACSDDAAGAALALALAFDGLRAAASARAHEGEVLWVQDRASRRLTGRPYRAGLPAPWRDRLIHVSAASCEDALFALEEGVSCRELACVIGEIAGNPRALDFTASRRLGLATEKHGVPLFLIRHDARVDLSSARMRWQVGSAPSLAPRWDTVAPGSAAWRAELFRARLHAPGQWILRDDGYVLAADARSAPPDRGDLAGAAGDRSLAAG